MENAVMQSHDKVMMTVLVDKVVFDPGQPRKNKPQSHINSLAESISKEGLEYAPHVLPPNGDDHYIVHTGECRTRAIKDVLKWREMPVIVRFDLATKSAEDRFILQIVENVVRKDMDIMETIEAYHKALDHGVTISDLAKAFGVSVSTIEKDLPLVHLPETLQRDIDQKSLSKEIARKLADLHPEFTQDEIKDAWKHVKRAPSADGQSKRLEVWKTQKAQGKTELELAKEDTSHKDRKKFARAVGQFMNQFVSFQEKINKEPALLSGAMYALTDQIKSGTFQKDLESCQKTLDKVKEALAEFEAHK